MNNISSWNYKRSNNIKYSAGILPYTFDQNGLLLFLFGKDPEGDWSDFGGRCEFKDHNDPINTASREFYEETLGSVINISDCIIKINNISNGLKIVSKTLNGSPYYMYLIYIDHLNYTDTFIKTFNFLKYQFDKNTNNRILEKTNIRWFTSDTLINCIENKNKDLISLRGVFYKTILNFKDQIMLLSRN